MSTRSYVGFNQLDTRRNSSDAVWQGCPVLEIITGERSGVWFYDDFLMQFNTGANAQVPGYKVVGTTGTATLLATDDGGVMELATGAGANQEAYFSFASAVGSTNNFKNATSNEIWFECRFRMIDISANSGFFIGFTRPADVASGFLTNTTFARVGTADYVGFGSVSATPTKIDIVYNTAGTETVYSAGAGTMVANTFIKVGLHYFGNKAGGANTNRIRYYINGVEIANTAATALGNTATATNFPNAVQMAPIFAVKEAGGAVNSKLDLDWWRMAQLVDDQ